MAIHSTDAPAMARSRGRAYFWAGLAAVLVSLIAVVVQFSLKHLVVPWYLPPLTTVAACLLLISVATRRTFPRIMALLLVAALAAFQWYFLVWLSRLPSYEGPARAGQKLPAFATALADGRLFTEQDLAEGSPTVVVFFRGRW